MSPWISLIYVGLLCLLQDSAALPAAHLLLPSARDPMDVKVHSVAPQLSLSHPALTEPSTFLQTLRRKRRRAHHRPRLMRVGCSLGTCQVQNLSHRLYQLMGQSGKMESPKHLSDPQGYG